MKKADIISGSIFEIPLDKDFGFTYVKLIFRKDILPSSLVDYIILKPYNIFESKSLNIDKFDSKIFETDNLLMFPLLMNGFPRLKGDNKWIFKGISKLTEEDKVFPDFISSGFMNTLTQGKINEACSSEYGCRVELGDYTNGQDFVYIHDFHSINHLGQWQQISSDGIKTLLTMTWLKKQEKNILDYYSKEDFDKDFWLEYTYNIVMENDFDFSKVKFKGRLKIKK